MRNNTNATVQVLHSDRVNERVEVIIEQHAGEQCVVLRHCTWTDGLGWCAQKTIRLAGEQIDDLHRALTVARRRLNQRRAEAGQPVEPAQVIHLPTVA